MSEAAGAQFVSEESDDPEAALRSARNRFVSAFPQRIDALRLLAASADELGEYAPIASLRQLAHKMVGLAGMVGFPTVSARARALEDYAVGGSLSSSQAARLIGDIESGFGHDVAQQPPLWVRVSATAANEKILVIEDDPEQRAILASTLRGAGFRVAQVADGGASVASAQTLGPDLVVLDVDLPGLDGFSICRQMKADPGLAHIPIVFLTSRAQPMERMAGLTLGADDYVTKPYDPAELLLRLRRVLRRTSSGPSSTDTAGSAPAPSTPLSPRPPPAPSVARSASTLDYEAFVVTAQEALRRSAGALALLRVTGDLDEVAAVLHDELRRRDLIGRYGRAHLVVLMPDLTVAAAAERLDGLRGRIRARGASDIAAGVAHHDGGAADLDALLGQADLALAAARLSGRCVETAGQQQTVAPAGGTAPIRLLIAEDDPDILHVIDPRLRAAGLKTAIAFDGEQTLRRVAQDAPDVVLLDLMMPKLTGFDVLARIRELPPPRPRVIVVSARGREEDVTRAFELGADDYVTKPFSPQELLARISRLMR